MKFFYLSFFSTILSLVPISLSFSMDLSQEERLEPVTPIKQKNFDSITFVRSFLPMDSTPGHIQKVAKCYNSLCLYKRAILHDDHILVNNDITIAPLNVVTYDYGWGFPIIPRIQRPLLEFIAQSKQKVNIMDIGPGFGYDSLCCLLTKNIENLLAIEKEKRQYIILQDIVRDTLQEEIDPNFPLEVFRPFRADFLTFKIPPTYNGKFDILNVNKVIQFFDPVQTKTFQYRALSLLRQGGRLFITCLTPKPESELEKFMKEQDQNDFPGYVFHQEKQMIKMEGDTLIGGEVTLLELRKPRSNENAGHWLQKDMKSYALTDRVMHYHTDQTLAKFLGVEFKILETIITTPEENAGGIDYMISIVAEKQ